MASDGEYSGSMDERYNNEDSSSPEEQKTVSPPLYICIHQDEASGCSLWHLHTPQPRVYRNVSPLTPCDDCGCRGTLRRVR